MSRLVFALALALSLVAATPLAAQAPATEQAIEASFLQALEDIEQGQPRKAIERLEAILSEYPGLLRVRLELARAYFLIQDDEKAQFHFSYVLGAQSLPDAVQNSVNAFLNHIQARKRWAADFSLALLPQTNVGQNSDVEVIRLFGLPFRVDSRRRSGIGIELGGGIAWQPTLQSDLRGRVAVSSRARQYRNSDWDDTILGSDIGILRLFDGGSIGAGVRAQRRWFGGNKYLLRRGFWGSLQRIFLQRNRLNLNLEITHLNYDNNNNADAWSILITPEIHRGISARSQIRLSASAQTIFAREDTESSRLLGIGAGITHGFEGGLIISGDVGAHTQQRRARHPLFLKTRKDIYAFGRVRLLHREFRFKGFAPYVEYRYERNDSNIDLFSYDNHIGNIGITRKF